MQRYKIMGKFPLRSRASMEQRILHSNVIFLFIYLYNNAEKYTTRTVRNYLI